MFSLRVRLVAGLLILSVGALARAQTVNESSGVVILEAENFNANLSPRLSPPHSWTPGNSIAGASGTGYMEATPNDGTAGAANSTTPELQFTVNFNVTGTHYVWVRGHAAANTDDSVFTGIDGAGSVASTLTQYNAWQWSNTQQGSANAPTVSVGTTGNHTVNLWIREDGLRVDRVILTTNATFAPRVGNAWHIPNNADPAGATASMRAPFTVTPGASVTIYNGNQFQGTGEAGNQLQTGSTLFYKRSVDNVWTAVAMTFDSQSGNNKYFRATIPSSAFIAGDTIQYYLKIAYSDHMPTFLYGTDTHSNTTELEAIAQASPFSFTVQDLAFWQAQNIYQIITDRFFDGDAFNNNADGNYNPTATKSVHGGDFKGIEQKLDYIKSLGATAIWISPIVLNTEGQFHGYAGRDFYKVDPHWGTLADLQQMTAAAHARGLLVINDVVANHGGNLVDSGDSGFPAYKASGYNLRFRDNSRQYPTPFDLNATNPTIGSLFHNFGNISNYGDSTQVERGDLNNLDDFKTESAYVRTQMTAIYNFWIEQAGFDGFRIDTVKHVEHGFWQSWAPQIHQFATALGKPNFFLFGEALDGSDAKVGSYTGTKAGGAFELDSNLDYALYFKINSVFATASGNTKQIEDHYNAIAANYDPVAQNRLVTFLDNHDQRRFLNSSNANNNLARLRLALTWLYTSRGIPCLYYGTEQDFNGGSDPNNREDMFAGGFEQGPSLGDNFNMALPDFQLVAKLNNFRRLYPALSLGTHVNLWNDPNAPGLFAYARRLGTQEVFVVLNTAAGTQTLPARNTIYPAGTVLVNLLNPAETITINSTPQTPSISMPATTAKLFIAQSLVQPLDPVVTNISPAHDAANVATSAPLTITFSKPMNTAAIEAAFSTTPATTGSFVWSAQHDAVTYTAADPGWPGSTLVTVRIAPSATDAVSGKAFYAAFEARFATAASSFSDTSPPLLQITAPADHTTVNGLLSVSGTASDNIAVQRVDLQLDGGSWFPATGTDTWSLSLDSTHFLNGSHTLAVRAVDTAGNVSGITLLQVRFVNVPGEYLQRISAGNIADAVDCDGNVWAKDQPYAPGSFGNTAGFAGNSANLITGICPEAQALYQHERSTPTTGTFRYLFDCPAGVYETTLLEAETIANGPNQRLFHVFIDGQQVLSSFDIFAEAGGANIALSRLFTSTVADAQLEVQFTPSVGDARISGIQVRKIADVFSDTDGIPDWWRLAYFDHATGEEADQSRGSDDADGDGESNLDEFTAGTDPVSASSKFVINFVEIIGEDVRVTWTSIAGKTYQLQRASSPDSSASWENTGDPSNATSGTTFSTDPGASSAGPKFYRVIIP